MSFYKQFTAADASDTIEMQVKVEFYQSTLTQIS